MTKMTKKSFMTYLAIFIVFFMMLMFWIVSLSFLNHWLSNGFITSSSFGIIANRTGFQTTLTIENKNAQIKNESSASAGKHQVEESSK